MGCRSPPTHARPQGYGYAMDDDIVRIEPADDEIAEEYVRRTDQPDLRGVDVYRIASLDRWHWHVALGIDGFAPDRIEVELNERMPPALLAVPGVTEVAQESREMWLVPGTPKGEDLLWAAAQTVDQLADRTQG